MTPSDRRTILPDCDWLTNFLSQLVRDPHLADHLVYLSGLEGSLGMVRRSVVDQTAFLDSRWICISAKCFILLCLLMEPASFKFHHGDTLQKYRTKFRERMGTAFYHLYTFSGGRILSILCGLFAHRPAASDLSCGSVICSSQNSYTASPVSQRLNPHATKLGPPTK